MGFISLSEISRNHGGVSRTAGLQPKLLLSCTGETKKYKARVRFTVKEALVKEARLQPGDRIDVLYDPETRLGLLRRVHTGGFALTFRRDKRRNALDPNGHVQFTYRPEMGLPFTPGLHVISQLTMSEDGILFELPASMGAGPKDGCGKPAEGANCPFEENREAPPDVRKFLAQLPPPAALPSALGPPARGDKEADSVRLDQIFSYRTGRK